MRKFWQKIKENAEPAWIFPITGVLMLSGALLYQFSWRAEVSTEVPEQAQVIVDTTNKIEDLSLTEYDDEQDEAPTLSEKEIYKDPYIKHIRLALNNYLKGSSQGIEDDAISAEMQKGTDLECGLANFDKGYYKSKFFIYSTEAGKYGGRVADIVFIDKPDTLFEVLVYQYGTGEYVLRYFCKAGPPKDMQDDFTKIMKELAKELEYSL